MLNDPNPTIPLLKIEKILLGYNYLYDESQHHIQSFRKLCFDQIGYIPLVFKLD